MKKILLGFLIGATFIAAIFYVNNASTNNEKQVSTKLNYNDAEYLIDGIPIRLEAGVAMTEAAPGSAEKITTRNFGMEYPADLNNDGREDIVFLLTQNNGGTGTFYYVVGALNTEQGYVGTDSYLLGDRIAPQSIEKNSPNEKHTSVIVVNFADRAVGEPMTTSPSIGKSVYLKLDTASMMWGVVEPNFTGEADSSRMSLTMKDWTWMSALYNDERTIEPRQSDRFILSFYPDGRFSATTDCNSISGSYAADDALISFGEIAMTKMYCENSQEVEFATMLEHSTQYHFTPDGELVLGLKFDSGTMMFK